MKITICKDSKELGKKASADACQIICNAIAHSGKANIILATGASQFEILQNLVSVQDINWNKVTMFHLDEYVNLPESHPASFRNYIKQRFISKLPLMNKYFLINGENQNPAEECVRLGKIITGVSIDLALTGIGENGHLAFNDPPADFNTDKPYLIVDLDDACRRQQLDEGWFASLDEVPHKAISMSIRQIMKSKNIICSVPDKRKAKAVSDCMEGEISNLHPASILQDHLKCTVYLDEDSASLLKK